MEKYIEKCGINQTRNHGKIKRNIYKLKNYNYMCVCVCIIQQSQNLPDSPPSRRSAQGFQDVVVE